MCVNTLVTGSYVIYKTRVQTRLSSVSTNRNTGHVHQTDELIHLTIPLYLC